LLYDTANLDAKNKCEIMFLAIWDKNDDMVPKISWSLFFCRRKSPLDLNGRIVHNYDMVPKISWNFFVCRRKSPLDVNGIIVHNRIE